MPPLKQTGSLLPTEIIGSYQEQVKEVQQEAMGTVVEEGKSQSTKTCQPMKKNSTKQFNSTRYTYQNAKGSCK